MLLYAIEGVPMDIRTILSISLAALSAGCATTPLPATDKLVSPLTPADAVAQGQPGMMVRWGGLIVETRPGKGETCFEISSRPLDSGGEPLDTDRTFGRFIACANGFHEPSVYTALRKLTVVGVLEPPVKGTIGEHEFIFPRIKADAIHLWPAMAVRPYPYPPYHDPFWNWPFHRRYWW